MTDDQREAGCQLVLTEAAALDQQDFDSWLDLFTDDAVYWVPAWIDGKQQTSDPERELSLVYYRGKEHLRDRVDRLRSGTSPVSRTLPRVSHLVSSLQAVDETPDTLIIRSSFATFAFYPRTDSSAVHFGQYEHTLVRSATHWRIARKLIRLANDVIPTVLDINAL